MTYFYDEDYPIPDPSEDDIPQCSMHPDSSMEWDGFTMICIGCILAVPVDLDFDEAV